MDFLRIYWTLSGFMICIPLLVISVQSPRRSLYPLRLALAAASFLWLSNLFEKFTRPYSDSDPVFFLQLILIHMISAGIFFFCNQMELKRILYGKIWGTIIYYGMVYTASIPAYLSRELSFLSAMLFWKITMILLLSTVLGYFWKYKVLPNVEKISTGFLSFSLLLSFTGILFNSVCFQVIPLHEISIYLFQLFVLVTVVLVLIMQLEYIQRQRMAQETAILEHLLQEQRKQFEEKQESRELIHQKFHDLKHELSAIRYLIRDEQGQEAMDRILEATEGYAYIIETGNEVLDAILSEKAALFRKNRIHMNCMIDENLDLSGIRIPDLYVILGNALDNVLENYLKGLQPEQKYVHIHIYKDKSFLRMQILNSYAKTLVYENGLPITDKADTMFHGFGLKSIRRIVESYNGGMSIQSEDGEFALKILIPLHG